MQNKSSKKLVCCQLPPFILSRPHKNTHTHRKKGPDKFEYKTNKRNPDPAFENLLIGFCTKYYKGFIETQWSFGPNANSHWSC